MATASCQSSGNGCRLTAACYENTHESLAVASVAQVGDDLGAPIGSYRVVSVPPASAEPRIQ
jgi:hypothetical protein